MPEQRAAKDVEYVGPLGAVGAVEIWVSTKFLKVKFIEFETISPWWEFRQRYIGAWPGPGEALSDIKFFM